jgi:TPR repeat protein
VLAWKFDLPGLIRARLHHQPAQQQAAGPCDIAAIKEKSQAGELGFVQGCLGSSPSNQDILKVAEAAAAAGHCDAARRLFVHVAQGGDAQAALAYARRFDPQAKVDKQCTGDDPDTAAYWYRIPAEAGNVEAQRRLGMLLLQLHASGIEHDEGLKYLRQAAAAGDAEAKAALEKANAPP